jgi:type III pantothenate kinase
MVSQPRTSDVPGAQAYHRGVILAVDIGNSAAKAAIVDGADVLEAGRLDTSEADADDLLDGLRVLAGSEDEGPSAILTVSVVDRWTHRLEWAAEQMDLPLTVVAASHIPISTVLLRPDQTGPDRLLAAWAAANTVGTPIIVVDLGTATTVDAVDADGFFLGGAILPGIGTSADALAERAARLPRIELGLPAEAIGDGTAAAIASGVVIGHIGAVRELVTRMSARIAPGDRPPRVVVTGGHAEAPWAEQAWLEPAGDLPPVADRLDHELVLRGLGLLAEHMSTHPGVRVHR